MAKKIVGNPDVVDRETETKDIVDLVKADQGTQVVIIAASTAIGKSALQRKVTAEIRELSLGITPVVVKTIPSNEKTIFSDWMYIDGIFDKTNETFPYGPLSFEYYYLHTPGLHRRQRNSNLIERFSESNKRRKFWKYLVGQVVKRATLVGEYDLERICSEDSVTGHHVRSQYIKYVLSNRRIFLSIDNLQNIDGNSLRELANCLNETKAQNHVILLEYTLSPEKSLDDARKYKDYLASTGVLVELVKLDTLPPEYIVDAVQKNCYGLSNGIGLTIGIQEYYKNQAHGNIWQTVDFALSFKTMAITEPCELTDATVEKIESLSDEGKFVFSLIAEMEGSLPISILDEIILASSMPRDMILAELHEEGIAEEADACLRFQHASIKSAWENNPSRFEAYHHVARNQLIKAFERKLGEPSEKIFSRDDHLWIPLLKLYSGYKPEKIETLFSYLEVGIVKNIAPSIAWNFLRQFCEKAFVSIERHVPQFKQVLRICFTCELYEEGISVLDTIEKRPDLFAASYLLLNRAMFNSALDRHKDNIDLYEKSSIQYDPTTRVWLNLSLIALSSYRSLGCLDRCKQLVHEIERYKNLKSMYEYGILLRLSDIYLNRDEALPRLKKSVRFFQKRGDVRQEAKSLLTYSYVLAQLGKPGKAYKYICKAEELLKGSYIGMHMVFVNQSMALLLDGCYDIKVWNLLDKAESTAIVPFDKLGIVLNKIAWCCATGRYDLVSFLEKTALDLIPHEPDPDGVCLVYHNLSVVFEQMGDTAKAQIYHREADKLKEHCRPIKAKYDGKKTKETRFILERSWYAGGLAYWTYDLPEIETASS